MNLKLRGKRVEKGYSQADLAKLLEISTNAYNLKENGKNEFTLSEIQDLLYYLDCDFDDIFYRKEVVNNCEELQ